MKRLVIYHASCADGFTAAWVAWLKYGDSADYVPAQYGDSPPAVRGRDVLIVDFSYPRETLLRMHSEAESLLVVDHHKTAEKDLSGLSFCRFDQGWCGAALTWLELKPQPDRLLSPLICYVQDRDLWKWELPESKAINAYIATVPRDFKRWSELDKELDNRDSQGWPSPTIGDLQSCVDKGRVALRVVEQYVESQQSRAGTVTISGHQVPCINTTFAISELVGALAEGQRFAAGWFQRDDGRFVYSLRSRGDGGADMAEIARGYGGGGHKNAAGFTVDALLPACGVDVDDDH